MLKNCLKNLHVNDNASVFVWHISLHDSSMCLTQREERQKFLIVGLCEQKGFESVFECTHRCNWISSQQAACFKEQDCNNWKHLQHTGSYSVNSKRSELNDLRGHSTFFFSLVWLINFSDYLLCYSSEFTRNLTCADVFFDIFKFCPFFFFFLHFYHFHLTHSAGDELFVQCWFCDPRSGRYSELICNYDLWH